MVFVLYSFQTCTHTFSVSYRNKALAHRRMCSSLHAAASQGLFAQGHSRYYAHVEGWAKGLCFLLASCIRA